MKLDPHENLKQLRRDSAVFLALEAPLSSGLFFAGYCWLDIFIYCDATIQSFYA